MKTTGLFRRNTVVTTSHKRDDDFADYATVISAEDDPKRLKEYITKIYKAYRDKSKSLRSAYAKLDLLNNEITQEKTRFHDIEDENQSLRDQMQGMADQLVSKEEEFNEWQKQLAEQTKREREVLSEEFEEQGTQLKERINQLEDALNLANLEITRLTIEMAELTDPCQSSASDSGNESRSSLEILFTDKKKNFDQDKHELTKQILEITQRRMSLQTELTLVEEENTDLKLQYTQITKENQTLRRENDELKQQVGKKMFMRSMEDVNLDD
ncbi:11146_t:CDS:2 [Entrophospora sp. SA101]|nr:8647_t:CDS:2 [Entrophospora candida]CAH1759901.1 13502_t:CDS:2 [Entrophospora sp. SA101]CAG8440290.1 9756_t:CDS:2 [Entrophospora candida]CAJ0646215.1 8791_t:CDS:2 [Entrophospora sp. SA101]CAJ0746576.1 15099_t:CDS:2 [Entrophospora sp. SA101]